MFKKKFLLIPVLLTAFSLSVTAQNYADSMLAFFSSHKNTSSIICIKNDTLQVSWNPKEVMPMAATSNLLVAFEFAKQTAYKVIDTAEWVPLKELAKYYLPGAKIDQYGDWLSMMMSLKKTDEGRVKLLDVAVGMLQFASPALTEYLMDRLGFDNIKSNLQSLGMSEHSAIVPPVSSLVLFQNKTNTNPKKIKKAIGKMGEEEYCKSAYLMHRAIKYDSLFKSKIGPLNVSKEFMRMWSDRLPQSNTLAYGQFLQMVIKEKLFEKPIYENLRKVLEWPMKFPTVSNMFNRFSMTGSATPFVFAQAQYAVNKNNEPIIVVYTCVDLQEKDYASLSRWHQQFELNLFTRPEFLSKAAAALK